MLAAAVQHGTHLIQQRYTVGDALDDWIEHGLDGRSERTVKLYWDMIAKALKEHLGRARLTELTAADVYGALAEMAPGLSTRTLQIAHNVLVRAIRPAERDNLVGRNVAALVDPPKGKMEERPSKGTDLRADGRAYGRGQRDGPGCLHRRIAAVRRADRGSARFAGTTSWPGLTSSGNLCARSALITNR
jgi:hypothetical protein